MKVVQEVECHHCHTGLVILEDDRVTQRTYVTVCTNPDCKAEVSWTDEGDG